MSCAGDFLCSDQAMHLHQKLPVDATGFFWVTNVLLLYQLECFFSLLEKYSGLKKTGMFSCYLGSMLL